MSSRHSPEDRPTVVLDFEVGTALTGPRPASDEPDAPDSGVDEAESELWDDDSDLLDAYEDDPDLTVRLSSPGFEPASGRFLWDLDEDARMNRVAADIESDLYEREDLADIGAHLWAAMMPRDVDTLFREIRQANNDPQSLFDVRLSLVPEVASLPWESLHDEKELDFLAAHPQFCITRQVKAERESGSIVRTGREALSVLVAIPDGSHLQVDREWRNLEYAMDRLSDKVILEKLDGLVTIDRLADELGTGKWDAFHFVGHGMLDDERQVTIRLNSDTKSDQAHWVPGAVFANAFINSSVQMAVLNCCYGGAPSSSRSLAGLGPLLVRVGVEAVVAMRYEIPDDEAIAFSREFYGKLLSSAGDSRVQRAVSDSRRKLYLNQSSGARGFITPVLTLSEGPSRLTAIPVIEAMARPEVRHEGPAGGGSLDDDLEDVLEVLASERLVLVVGPGTLKGPVRSAGKAGPQPLALAKQLAAICDFPEREALERREVAEGWLADRLLQRVCQHFYHKEGGGAYGLVNAIRSSYGEADPPTSLETLAGWPTPGVVYLHYDGLLARAMDGRGKSYRSMNRIHEAPSGDPSLPLLAHVRGAIDDFESLVLTEEDHEALWKRLGSLHDAIVDLITQEPGRGVMFLGASRGDPLLRRFLGHLLPNGPVRGQGPMFFVNPRFNEADAAYWSRFSIRAITRRTEDVIEALAPHVT